MTERTGPLRRVLRDVVRVDPSGLAALPGLRACVGVSLPLVVGVAAGAPVTGVVFAGGALSVGVVSLTGGGAPPTRRMAATAVAMGLSTFVGSVSGGTSWLHVPLLAAWAFAGGLLVALGNSGAVVGLQALIAFVVFGRFGQPVGGAARLGAFVLAGGALQTALASLVRRPAAFRGQQRAAAAAYRELAALVRSGPEASTLPAADALDAAAGTLTGAAVWHWPGEPALRSLVDDGGRVRLELLGLASVRGRLDPADRGAVEEVLALAARVLDAVAASLDGTAGDPPTEAAAALAPAAGRLRAERAPPPAASDGLAEVADRLDALAGQLRAVAALAERVGELAGRPRPSVSGVLAVVPRRPVASAADAVRELRANLDIGSTAFRHAVRLTVVVPVAALIALHSPLQRGYWVELTAAIVLKPEFTTTFTRGVARLGGTCVGVLVASLVATTLHPAGWVLVAVVAGLSWATYTTFQANYAVFTAVLTALVVFLLSVVVTDPVATAVDRLVDTLIGGALALVAYAAWPTWAHGQAREALGALAAEVGRYVDLVLAGYASGAVDDVRRAELARGLRLARSNAEAAVDRSLGEPSAHRLDAAQGRGALAGLRRCALAAHALAADLRRRPGAPVPAAAQALDALRAGLVDALGVVEQAVRTGVPAGPLPPLRALHGALGDATGTRGAADPAGWLLAETDEMVDAVDTVAHLLGQPAAVEVAGRT